MNPEVRNKKYVSLAKIKLPTTHLLMENVQGGAKLDLQRENTNK